MGKTRLISIVVFLFLISFFWSTRVEGRFEIVRRPCFPGSILIPENCKSCICDLFGAQFYCLSFCQTSSFQRPGVRPRTTRQRPRTTTTLINVTPRSLQISKNGLSIQSIIDAANATAQVQGRSENNTAAA